MFEPAKNSKAPDFSEALILLGRDGEIRTHDPLHPIPIVISGFNGGVGVVKGALIVNVVSIIPRRNHIIYLVQPVRDQTIGGAVVVVG